MMDWLYLALLFASATLGASLTMLWAARTTPSPGDYEQHLRSLRRNNDYSEPPCCHYYGLSSQDISSRIFQGLLMMSDAEQGRLAQAIHDWLVPLDDGFCYRHTACTLCGVKGAGYYDCADLQNGLSIAYRLCLRCHALDTDRSRTAAVLTKRYGQGQGD